MPKVIASFSIVPVGTEETGVSSYVAAGIRKLEQENIDYKLTSMATIVEADTLDEVFEIVEMVENAMIKEGSKRLVLNIDIDHRLDKPKRKSEDKVKDVEKILKESRKT